MMTRNKTVAAVQSDGKAPHWYLGFLLSLLALVSLIAISLVMVRAQRQRYLSTATVDQLRKELNNNPGDINLYIRLGTRLEEAGDYNGAYRAFALVVRDRPDDENALLNLARATQRISDDATAFALFKTFITRHPRAREVRLALAWLYYNNQDMDRAWRSAIEATKFLPNSSDAWFLRGIAAAAVFESRDAETSIRHALSLNSKDWRYHTALGDILGFLIQTKDKTAPLLSYEEAIRLHPDTPAPYLARGRLLLSQAITTVEIEAAQRDLQRAWEMDSQNPVTLQLLGSALRQLGRWQEARKYLETARRYAPYDKNVSYVLSRVYLHLGDKQAFESENARHTKIEYYLKRKLQLFDAIRFGTGSTLGPRLALAKLLMANGEYGEAERQYRQMLFRDPQLAPARSGLARAKRSADTTVPDVVRRGGTSGTIDTLIDEADHLLSQHQFKDAALRYGRAAQISPRSVAAWEGAGKSYLALDQPRDAFFSFHKALEIDPTAAEASIEMARMYLGAQLFEGARILAVSVTRHHPDRAEGWNLLGNIYREQQNSDAEAAFARAIAQEPENVSYLLDLAEEQSKRGQQAEAESNYRKALALAPQNQDALVQAANYFVMYSPSPEHVTEAETWLRRVMDHSPENPSAILAMARLCLVRRNGADALHWIERFHTVVPDAQTMDIHYLTAKIYQLAGKRDQAQAALKLAIQVGKQADALNTAADIVGLHPADSGARLRLARCCAQNGENARAMYHYKACLLLDRSNGAARDELNRLSEKLTRAGRLPDMPLYTAMLDKVRELKPMPVVNKVKGDERWRYAGM